MSAYTTAVLAKTPKVYARLDETSGTAIADSSGNAHGGTISGTYTLNQASLLTSDSDAAILFTQGASGAVVDFADPADFQKTQFSVEVWAKARSGSTNVGSFFNKTGMFDMYSYQSVGANKVFIWDYSAGGGVGNEIATGYVLDTSRHHFLLAVDGVGATATLYVDGASVWTGPYGVQNVAGGTLQLGWDGNASNQFDGTLDEFAFYPSVLNLSQASANFAAGSTALPTNSVAPAVTGTATVGQILTTTDGTWTGSPTITRQWQRDANGSGSYTNIPAATATTYTLTDTDDACHIKCVVTATNAGGFATATSNIVGPVVEVGVPANTVAPTVSGSAPQGSTLTASTGTWSNVGNSTTYAYQWTRAGVNISLATSANYSTQVADIGTAVGCKVTPTNDVGAGTATASSNTITVTAASPFNIAVMGNGRPSNRR